LNKKEALMIVIGPDLDPNALARRWWTFLLRGVASISFGVLTIVWPGISLLALVSVWGAYALSNGAINMVLSARAGHGGERWGWLLFEGLMSIAAGAVAFLRPEMTALALAALIGAWALFAGVAQIFAAIELRRVIPGEVLLGCSGLLSTVFGALMMFFPRIGVLAMVTVVGAYALLFGALLIVLSIRLHRRHARHDFPVSERSPSHA
jgi:uncharacterized membrane protein HdeD (DUF308 family)